MFSQGTMTPLNIIYHPAQHVHCLQQNMIMTVAHWQANHIVTACARHVEPFQLLNTSKSDILTFHLSVLITDMSNYTINIQIVFEDKNTT